MIDRPDENRNPALHKVRTQKCAHTQDVVGNQKVKKNRFNPKKVLEKTGDGKLKKFDDDEKINDEETQMTHSLTLRPSSTFLPFCCLYFLENIFFLAFFD